MPLRQVKVTPGGAIGQSAVTVHVGTQRCPIGVVEQVQPRDPVGHAPVQSAVVVHARGPASAGIAASTGPASGGAIPPSPGTPPSGGGPIIANDASGVAWKHRGMYGNVLVST